MVNTLELANGNFVTMAVAEVTAVPYFELYDKALDRANYMNQVLFTQIISSMHRKSIPNQASFGNVKKCAVGKHPKSEKLGGIGSGCRLRLRPLPVLHRRQSQRVARIDPNAVVVDKNIAENDRFDLFSR